MEYDVKFKFGVLGKIINDLYPIADKISHRDMIKKTHKIIRWSVEEGTTTVTFQTEEDAALFLMLYADLGHK